MQCWIIGSKRYGSQDERCWEVSWYGPAQTPGDPDSAPEYFRSFKSESAARKFAEKQTKRADNYWGVVTIQQYALQQVEGNDWDWERVGLAIELECA